MKRSFNLRQVLGAVGMVCCVAVGSYSDSLAADIPSISPPSPISQVFDVPSGTFFNCNFNLRVLIDGLTATLVLPGGRIIITAPNQFATLINLNNSKQISINITAPLTQTTDAAGNITTFSTGRSLLGDPVAGLVLAIGRFSFVFDRSGNLIQPLQGKGQLQDVCAPIS